MFLVSVLQAATAYFLYRKCQLMTCFKARNVWRYRNPKLGISKENNKMLALFREESATQDVLV